MDWALIGCAGPIPLEDHFCSENSLFSILRMVIYMGQRNGAANLALFASGTQEKIAP